MDRRVAGQGERCVILVRDQECAEIIQKDGNVLTLLRPDGTEKRGLAEEFAGWAPVLVTKIIKAVGWMYYAPGTVGRFNLTGTNWYTVDGVNV